MMIDICDRTVEGLVEKGLAAAGKLDDDETFAELWENIFVSLDGPASPEQGFLAGLAASAITDLIDARYP